MPFGNSQAESHRDSGAKPRVARHKLPWETRPPPNHPNGVAPINPNSEVGNAPRAAARAAHAAGEPFSAARRKLHTTHFFVRGGKLELGHDGLGGPPKPARGPRALPIPISEFGLKVGEAAENSTADFPVCCVARLPACVPFLVPMCSGLTRTPKWEWEIGRAHV